MSQLKEQQDRLKLSFKEIELATKSFSKCVGKGGYGRVYLGELFISETPTPVAVKRLNENLGQGLKEFLTEIELLSGQHHPNIISLLGYCDEGMEKIIVYEYAERGSLDKYIKRRNDGTENLSWVERLKICADAARGLDHLHSHAGEHQSIIHRDIKSANILINNNWDAKISDLGLSKLSLAGLDRSAVISNACGTRGYCEPEYVNSGVVTKKSDVYSFGMVLFEVLCGRLCTVKEDDGFLLSGKLAKDYYKQNKLDEIVDPSLIEQMSSYSMSRFSAIAYRCLHDDREQRPPMDVVKKELEETLKIQVEYEVENARKLKDDYVVSKPDSYWETKLPQDWEVIIKMLDFSHASFISKKKLFFLLHKGILFDEGNKVFWINDDEKNCLLISARRFISLDHPTYPRWVSNLYLRFPRVAEYYYKECHDIKCQIKTSMLSLGTMYSASLVFKYREQPNKDPERLKLIRIKWKMEELRVCSTHSAELIENNWYKIKMWHFNNRGPNADFNIVIEELSYIEDPIESELLIQGIELHPTEMMQHEETASVKYLSILDEDEYWVKKLPNDYQGYIQRSDKLFHYTNYKELYLLFRKGFLGDNGQLWLSVCKLSDGICSMLPARNILPDEYNYKCVDRLPLSKSRFRWRRDKKNPESRIRWAKEPRKSESRFGEVIKLQEAYWYSFECRLQSHMFSPQYIYACYLVFKFEDDHILPNDTCFFKAWYNLDDKFGDTYFAHLNSSSINIPTIKTENDFALPMFESPRIPERHMERLVDSKMEKRKDGWMEVMLCKPLKQLHNHMSLRVTLSKCKSGSFSGIIVEGMEFRPVQ